MIQNRFYSHKKTSSLFCEKNARASRYLTLVALALLLSACATKPEMPSIVLDSTIKLDFAAGYDVNPNFEGRPSPIIVTVYELSTPTRFQGTSYLNLVTNPKDALGSDIVREHRLDHFVPGYGRQVNIALAPNTRYVGIVGEFVQYEKGSGKLIVPIQANAINQRNIVMHSMFLEENVWQSQSIRRIR